MGSRTFSEVLIVRGTISTNEIRSGRIGSGFVVPTVTVVSSGAATVSGSSPNTYPSTLHCRSELTARSIENAASAAVNGVPSENVTPRADIEGPLGVRCLPPTRGQQRRQIARARIALDQRLGDVGPHHDTRGSQ